MNSAVGIRCVSRALTASTAMRTATRVVRPLSHVRTYAAKADPYAFGGAPEVEQHASEQQKDDMSKRAKRHRAKEAALEERNRVRFTQEVAALSARINEGLSDDIVARAVTDSSAELDVSNARLALLGTQVLRVFAMEHILAMYPKLPSLCARDIFSHITGHASLATIARKLGIDAIVRTAEEKADEKAVAQAFAAVVGAIHEENGPLRARQFVRDTVIAHMRLLDIKEKIAFEKPEKMLVSVLKDAGCAPPTYKLLTEAGRKTHQPTFVVGVYSDETLLGTGAGVSLRNAERDAVRAALLEKLATPVTVTAVPSDLVGA